MIENKKVDTHTLRDIINKSRPKSVNGFSPICIEGLYYWTREQFAQLTDRSELSVRQLLYEGNGDRKLEGLVIGDKVFVLYDELFDFNFIVSWQDRGKGKCRTIKYTLDGDTLKKDFKTLTI